MEEIINEINKKNIKKHISFRKKIIKEFKEEIESLSKNIKQRKKEIKDYQIVLKDFEPKKEYPPDLLEPIPVKKKKKRGRPPKKKSEKPKKKKVIDVKWDENDPTTPKWLKEEAQKREISKKEEVDTSKYFKNGRLNVSTRIIGEKE